VAGETWLSLFASCFLGRSGLAAEEGAFTEVVDCFVDGASTGRRRLRFQIVGEKLALVAGRQTVEFFPGEGVAFERRAIFGRGVDVAGVGIVGECDANDLACVGAAGLAQSGIERQAVSAGASGHERRLHRFAIYGGDDGNVLRWSVLRGCGTACAACASHLRDQRHSDVIRDIDMSHDPDFVDRRQEVMRLTRHFGGRSS
jgi:hypothetical protein